MKVMVRMLAGALVLALGSGCGSKMVVYEPVGGFALAAGPDKSADVVWLVQTSSNGGPEYERYVLRCHNSDQGPVCLRAKTQ